MNDLGKYIQEEIIKDFEHIFLSGNLRDTISLNIMGDKVTIEIPAMRYDLKTFSKDGTIVYTSGSYAEAINQSGGFSKQHKNYVERGIELGIMRWLKSKGIQAKVRTV